MKKQIIIILLFTICISCSNDSTKNEKFSDIDSVGELKDSLENGYWKFSNKTRTVKDGMFENGLKVGVWNYYYNDSIYKTEWNIFQKDSINLKINYPKNWRLIDNKQYLFCAKTESKDSNHYFVILEHNMIENQLKDLNDYFKIVSKQILQDKSELTKMSEFKEVLFTNGVKVITGKLESTIDGKSYIANVLYFEKDGFIYDSTFKRLLDSKNDIVQEAIFGDIVSSIFMNDKKLFISSFVKEVNPINLDSIYDKTFANNVHKK